MNKIDFVILWVNDKDDVWRKKRAKFEKYNTTTSDNREIRYRDWDNLKYWFRGIEWFAPWVHKIYFVTDHQAPTWLNKKHKKLVLVNHESFMDSASLPTFNSNAIEINLYKIPNLSERFVAFNDDMFITRPVKQTDFFYDKQPCDTGIMTPIQQPSSDYFGNILVNNLGIINDNFDKNKQIKKSFSHWFNFKYGSNNIKNVCLMPWSHFSGFYEPHLPISFCKSTFETIWEKYSAQLKTTSNNKFRNNKTDYSHWLMRDWQLASNNFKPRSSNFGQNYNLPDDLNKVISAINKQKYKTICINDSAKITNFQHMKAAVNSAFENILPSKSEFEL